MVAPAAPDAAPAAGTAPGAAAAPGASAGTAAGAVPAARPYFPAVIPQVVAVDDFGPDGARPKDAPNVFAADHAPRTRALVIAAVGGTIPRARSSRSAAPGTGARPAAAPSDPRGAHLVLRELIE